MKAISIGKKKFTAKDQKDFAKNKHTSYFVRIDSFSDSSIDMLVQAFTETKDWGEYSMAKAFMVYSFFTVVTLFLSGFLVDKFTGRKLILIMNIPLLLAMYVLFKFNHEIFAYIFLGLVGVSNGFANILGSSTWAEIYGVKYIGSIKALTTALMVFSTAFGTAVFGLLIDKGFTIESIAFIGGAYILLSLVLLIFFRKYI